MQDIHTMLLGCLAAPAAVNSGQQTTGKTCWLAGQHVPCVHACRHHRVTTNILPFTRDQVPSQGAAWHHQQHTLAQTGTVHITQCITCHPVAAIGSHQWWLSLPRLNANQFDTSMSLSKYAVLLALQPVPAPEFNPPGSCPDNTSVQ
jgi:hypothetical protein